MCRTFGHGAEDPVAATAARLLRANRGDLANCRRYTRYIALTRALNGNDYLEASLERGSLAKVWGPSGFLLRPPTHRYITTGKRPVMFFCVEGAEPDVVLRVPRQQLYACMHLQAQRYLHTEQERGEAGHVLIFDLAGFGWRHINRQFLVRAVQLVGMMLKHYPEMILKVIVIHAPAIFSVAWAAIVPFANDHVQSKVAIHRGDAKDVVVEHVGAEAAEELLLGEVEGEAGGAPADADAGPGEWTQVTIAAGATHTHEVVIPDDSSAEGAASLLVECAVEASELSVMVVRELADAGGSKAAAQEYAVEPESVSAAAGRWSKTVAPAAPGKYTVCWDNTQAWRYPRTVSFRVSVLRGYVASEGAPAADTEDSSLRRLPDWDGLSQDEQTALAAGLPYARS